MAANAAAFIKALGLAKVDPKCGCICSSLPHFR
jgi:hypothetical protein